MPEQLTFNVTNSTTQQSTKTYTCLTENKAFINSIITVGSENTVTETDIKKLQEVAARSGDMGIIEQSDLNGEEKIKLANANGFSDYYELNVDEIIESKLIKNLKKYPNGAKINLKEK